MKTFTSVKEIMELLERIDIAGLRGISKRDESLLSTGAEYLKASCDNWDSRECEYCKNKLNGTSAVGINDNMVEDRILQAYKKAKIYADYYHNTGMVYLIIGEEYEYGYDEGEYVFKSDFEEGARVLGRVVL